MTRIAGLLLSMALLTGCPSAQVVNPVADLKGPRELLMAGKIAEGLDAMSGMQAVSAGVAIAAFSVGVEIGHQVVVLPVFGCLYLLRRASADGARHDGMVRRYGSVAVSLIGMIYLVAALP